MDGKTVVTDSEDGVLRFWEAATGRFRAASDPRTAPFGEITRSEARLKGEHYRIRDTLIVGSDRVITRQREPGTPGGLRPPVELWDVETGRPVAELQESGDVYDLRIAAGGQRILGETNDFVVKDGEQVPETPHVIVWSSDDGRELLRTPYPGCDEDWFNFRVFAPSPRRLIAWTVCHDMEDWHGWYSWETGGWRLLQKLRYSGNGPDDSDVRELPDGRLALNLTGTWYLFRDDETEPQTSIEASSPGQFAGSRYWTVDGELFDVSTGKRLQPPQGRRFHPELAELSPDGRFVALYQYFKSFRIFDIPADKQVMTWWFDTSGWFAGTEEQWHTLSDRQLGFANGRIVNDPEDRLWLLQILLSIPEIPPQQLELWAQVALCGELGADDNFQYWDEPTWEQHRRELAQWPAVTADVPFPGFVAKDRRHWLRQQHDALVDELGYRSFGDATKEQENSIRVIEQLLERAQADGDEAEIGYWQTQLKSRQRD